MCHNEGGASQVYSQCISVAQTYISSMQDTIEQYNSMISWCEHFRACGWVDT